MTKEIESDNESVATEDIVEPTPEPTPDPFTEPTVHLNAVIPDPEPTPEPHPKPKRARGRPKTENKPDKSESTLHALTKNDLMKLVVAQHEVLNRRALIDEKQEEFIKEKVTNKRVKAVKEKKPRTQKQIDATKRMVEARKAKLAKDLHNAKNDIVEQIDNTLADKVADVVTDIISKPLRSLTPERMKKVEKYIEPKKKSRF